MPEGGERGSGDKRGGNDRRRKFNNAKLQHGSRNKRGDLGRTSWSRQRTDRRQQHEEQQAKRRRIERQGLLDEGEDGDSKQRKPSVLPQPFPSEEVAAEERRPKHKVAVLIGYAGTGYKGMQINAEERTIEGDLFTAFVAAGAISKANADDPKKSQLVRCARTDKGVHAAGNVISMKLIVEDEDVVRKINDALDPQIRVWGITRTIGSFSAYQACDSRWYEYFLPTHCFLPPHPTSVIAKRLRERAERAGTLAEFEERNAEVATFWADTEEKYIKPIIEALPPKIRGRVRQALDESQLEEAKEVSDAIDAEVDEEDEAGGSTTKPKVQAATQQETKNENEADASHNSEPPASATESQPHEPLTLDDRKAIAAAVKELKAAYTKAKRRWRIPEARLARIQPVLDQFLGTHSFHYYTVNKTSWDPSAKRVIKSFKLDPPHPILIGNEGKWDPSVLRNSSSDPNVTTDADAGAGENANNTDSLDMQDTQTEWISLRIHGQSFMMHQIRKMVSAIVLTVRCGGDPAQIIPLTLSQTLPSKPSITDVCDPTQIPAITIPKAPSLGLLLLHPVFAQYNEKIAPKFEREAITFETDDVKKQMDTFKYAEIYERMFREEKEGGFFASFWGHVDESLASGWMWVASTDKDLVAEHTRANLAGGKKRKMERGEFDEEREPKRRRNSIESSLLAVSGIGVGLTSAPERDNSQLESVAPKPES